MSQHVQWEISVENLVALVVVQGVNSIYIDKRYQYQWMEPRSLLCTKYHKRGNCQHFTITHIGTHAPFTLTYEWLPYHRLQKLLKKFLRMLLKTLLKKLLKLSLHSFIDSTEGLDKSQLISQIQHSVSYTIQLPLIPFPPPGHTVSRNSKQHTLCNKPETMGYTITMNTINCWWWQSTSI